LTFSDFDEYQTADQCFLLNDLLMCAIICHVTFLVLLASMLLNVVLNLSIAVHSTSAISNFVRYSFIQA